MQTAENTATKILVTGATGNVGSRVVRELRERGALNTDGSAQKRLTKNGVPHDASPAFSPTGKKITFETNRGGKPEIYEMRTDGTGPVNHTNDPAGDFTPDWQPLEEKH